MAKTQVDISVACSEVKISPLQYKAMQVEIEGVQLSDLIEQLKTGDILDIIGKDECKNHFDLTENE